MITKKDAPTRNTARETMVAWALWLSKLRPARDSAMREPPTAWTGPKLNHGTWPRIQGPSAMFTPETMPREKKRTP